MTKYELMPNGNQKSFYWKAYITMENGVTTLYSYDTPIIKRDHNFNYIRLFDGVTITGDNVGITATTLEHIKAFCNMNKKEFLAVKMEG